MRDTRPQRATRCTLLVSLGSVGVACVLTAGALLLVACWRARRRGAASRFASSAEPATVAQRVASGRMAAPRTPRHLGGLPPQASPPVSHMCACELPHSPPPPQASSTRSPPPKCLLPVVCSDHPGGEASAAAAAPTSASASAPTSVSASASASASASPRLLLAAAAACAAAAAVAAAAAALWAVEGGAPRLGIGLGSGLGLGLG